MNSDHREASAGPDLPVDCPECSSPLLDHQLDKTRPARMIATCLTCGQWYNLGLSGTLSPLNYVGPQVEGEAQAVESSPPPDTASS